MRFVKVPDVVKCYEVWDGPHRIGHVAKFKDGWWFNSIPRVVHNDLLLGRTLAEAKREIRRFGVVYLIHFDRPYMHAKHYLGWAQQLSLRLEHHRNGTGSRLLQVVRAEGIDWKLARVWVGNRALEKRLKGHSSTRYCPICQGAEPR